MGAFTKQSHTKQSKTKYSKKSCNEGKKTVRLKVASERAALAALHR